jgi:magnesium-protoporphyrin IX monomethyl ester (oxidative) cyclase
MQAATFTSGARLGVARPATRAAGARRSVVQPVRAAAETKEMVDDLGFKLMRKGVKEAAKETLLTPRFYTTDFDETDEIFNLEKNPNLPMEELTAMLEEFRRDYNQKHFVRSEGFQQAADKIQGPMRRIFIEFLERSCTAEFSGFLLYKELGRRLQKSNPVVAEIFTLLARDEARHAGFINKALSDFNLALDLGFLTKNRTYTFFRPKFIIYATFLSEKIGYWRYISIYRHLQRNPDNQLYPMFEYFENWCQDENRHGDFLTAVLKSRPELLNGWEARLWSRFFCLSVYITMYLNDHARSAFYEALGLNTTQFNRHVILETNNSTERVFPEVPDINAPGFWDRMDRMVGYNLQLVAIEKSDAPELLKTLQKLPLLERIAANVFQLFLMPTKRCGSLDIEGASQYQY